MFKIFLAQKLLSGTSDNDNQRVVTRVSRQRNRRLFDRYNVDQKSLTIMNEQDILVIRDLSTKGFSSDVSDRAFDRFLVGDVYSSRMRYTGKVYDITIKVVWKRNKTVGFELEKPNQDVHALFRRLLHPFEIGSSLREVDTAYTRANDEGKVWFHGEQNVDLYVWQDQNLELTAWTLSVGQDFISWSQGRFATGILKTNQVAANQNSTQDFFSAVVPQLEDTAVDASKVQLALDIFMASAIELKAKLIQTFEVQA